MSQRFHYFRKVSDISISFQGFLGFCGQRSEKVSGKIDIGFEVSRFPRFLEVS